MIPSATAAPCVAHKSHAPKPAYCELHHLIPQAWQAFYLPPTSSKRRLWAPATVALCPTGHRNIHVKIVAMMKAVEAAGRDDPLVAAKEFRRTHETEIAYAALAGFVDHGGSLLALCAQRLYGYA